MNYLVGVDIGTQGTKACLFQEDGTLVQSAFEPSSLISPQPGTVWQEPDTILQSCLNTISQVMRTSGVCKSNVVAVGLCGQMAGILGVDADYAPVTPYDSWLDTRCTPQIAQMKAAAGARILRLTGAPVTCAHGPKILWWKQQQPQAYAKISKFVLPTTYIAGKLCGHKSKDAYLDFTCLHFSGFGDIEKLQWSQELTETFGISMEKLPRITTPCERVGGLTRSMADACGLQEGTPVAAGAGDQAATSLGAGIISPGQAFDVAGTASVFSCATDVYTPDVEHETLLCPRSIVPGLWIPLAYISGGGLCLRWARDLLSTSDESGYERLNKLAEGIEPGSDHLVFIPHFSGKTCPYVPRIRGSFAGLTTAHGAGHLYRAVMEGIGYEYRLYLSIAEKLTKRHFTEIYAIGGGAKSPVFNQIKSSILGVPYTTLHTVDTGAWGAALTAGKCVGLYDDIAAATQTNIVRQAETLPNIVHTRLYQKYVAAYALQCEGLMKTYQALLN